ncbi:MAG: dienelactone hydrolase [Halioglobus sp.]|jgi:dienelactone hydrolase
MKPSVRKLVMLLLLLVVAAAAYSLWSLRDVVFIKYRSFEQTRDLLLPHLRIMQPKTAGRHPAILYFHGCGGPRESRAWRAQEAVDRGFVAIIFDSYTGREIKWERTCNGERMPGFQRAGDVFVALDIARKMPSVDPDQLFLTGYSHGAWTILEALALGDNLPRGLKDSPGHHLDGVRGLIAWYPYCGMAAQYSSGLQTHIPVLMLLAQEDRITPPQPCINFANSEQEKGYPLEWYVYPGVDHGFDLQEDWVRVYDPEVHAQSVAAEMKFLDKWRTDR